MLATTGGQERSEECWVFGYGSLINKNTHGSTLGPETPYHFVRLKSTFPYRRAWNFHSQTGFTALGLCPVSPDQAEGVNGILVLVRGKEALKKLDHREKGYERIELSRDHIMYINGNKNIVPNEGSVAGSMSLYLKIEKVATKTTQYAKHTLTQFCRVALKSRGHLRRNLSGQQSAGINTICMIRQCQGDHGCIDLQDGKI